MKNQAGIDLSELTQVQRKMCVKLLAANNIQIIQNKDTYVATIRVPTSDVKNYLNNQKNDKIDKTQKSAKKQQKTQKANKQNEVITKQKSLKDKSSTKSFANLPKKQPSKKISSKKSLFKSVKLPCIPKLQSLYPQVQIYIYPKRLPLIVIQQQIEQTYEQYWQFNKQSKDDIIKIYLQIVCPLTGPGNKSKNDQSILNSLQTINHFQHKQTGVKIFYKFLSQQYSQQQFSYFLVLRALVQQFIGQKIIISKSKHQNSTFSSNNTQTKQKNKLRWSPFQYQISQYICQSFLKVITPDKNAINNIFQKLTALMYYCQQKKGNFIMYYELMNFMINQFDKECVQASVTNLNLELSYSNNDSTLNDIFAQSARKSIQKPIQTKYQIQLIPQSIKELQYQPPEPEIINNDQILLQTAIEKATQMCRKLQIPFEQKKQVLQKVHLCIQSIRNMDKIKWVQAMQIQGSQQELNFIQNIQIQYKNMCKQKQKLTLANGLVRRIFSGPGFIKLFSSRIIF